MAIKCIKWPKYIPYNLPTSFIARHSKIWIFGFKIYHLATLPASPSSEYFFPSTKVSQVGSEKAKIPLLAISIQFDAAAVIWMAFFLQLWFSLTGHAKTILSQWRLSR
jgi:hypothetical protein